MIELGQLEANHREFANRKVRIIVSSMEGTQEAKQTQNELPNLVVLADRERGLSDAMQVIHARSALDGSDTSAPTTLLVDGQGIVRWVFRADRFFTRLTPEELLKAIDEHMSAPRP